MEKLSDEELNKWVHTVVMGECWHDFGLNPECKSSAERYYCPKCGAFSWDGNDKHPPYATDLNLAAKAEAKCIKRFGYEAYANTLMKICKFYRSFCATARQRCESMYAMYQNG